MEGSLDANRRAEQVNEAARRVRIDQGVVTRPASEASATVHGFLRHLRDQGLDCVPQPLEVRDGTETFAYIDGADGGDGWYHQHTDQGVASAARLLRRIHDAGRAWTPPDGAIWGAPEVPADEVVICHGDPGPWNFIWRDNEAIALIDWDFLHPGPRLDDVAYALQWFGPLRADEHALEWHHFPRVPDRGHRVQVFLDAYGGLPRFDVVDAVTARMQATSDLVTGLAQKGQEPQRTWVAEGELDRAAIEIAWVREHRADII